LTSLRGDFVLSRNSEVRLPVHCHRATLGLCVAAMGFTLLGLEVLLLLGFQALYGYIYQQLAVLVALFMVGMAAGAWLALKRTAPLVSQGGGYLELALLQVSAAAAPLLLYKLFVLLASLRSLPALLATSLMVFPGLALVAGLMGGYQFPLASRIYFAGSEEPEVPEGETQVRAPRSSLSSNRNPGILYGLDLLGACLGAVALSAYLIPVYGFLRTAIVMAVVNLGPAVLTALVAFEARPHRRTALWDSAARQRPAP